MKFLKASLVLSAILLISDRAVLSQVNIGFGKNKTIAQAQTLSNGGFQAEELPARLNEKPKFKDAADKVLIDCNERKFDYAMENAKLFVSLAKPKKDEIEMLTNKADALASTSREKAVALHMMAFQALKLGGRATADEAVARQFKIASVITSTKTNDSEREFATNLVEQGLRTRRIAGGIQQSDAPFVLLHGRLEFSLKRWDSAIKEYEYWLGMYSSKGQNPPANELPDALGELGIANTSLKNVTKAEEYFTRACAAANAFNGKSV